LQLVPITECYGVQLSVDDNKLQAAKRERIANRRLAAQKAFVFAV